MRIYLAVILSSLLVAGCGTKVTRIDVDETVDLSGAWNDTDSRLVAEEMIADALSQPWTLNFASQSGRAPVVIVGTVRNFSHEHINMSVEREIRSTTQLALSGARILGHWKDEDTGDVYAFAELDMDAVNKSLETATSLSDAFKGHYKGNADANFNRFMETN